MPRSSFETGGPAVAEPVRKEPVMPKEEEAARYKPEHIPPETVSPEEEEPAVETHPAKAKEKEHTEHGKIVEDLSFEWARENLGEFFTSRYADALGQDGRLVDRKTGEVTETLPSALIPEEIFDEIIQPAALKIGRTKEKITRLPQTERGRRRGEILEGAIEGRRKQAREMPKARAAVPAAEARSAPAEKPATLIQLQLRQPEKFSAREFNPNAFAGLGNTQERVRLLNELFFETYGQQKDTPEKLKLLETISDPATDPREQTKLFKSLRTMSLTTEVVKHPENFEANAFTNATFLATKPSERRRVLEELTEQLPMDTGTLTAVIGDSKTTDDELVELFNYIKTLDNTVRSRRKTNFPQLSPRLARALEPMLAAIMPNLPETLAGAPKTDREKRAAELKRIIPTPKPSEYFATRQPKKGFWARLFGR